jgi:hypothetical protein
MPDVQRPCAMHDPFKSEEDKAPENHLTNAESTTWP